MERFIKLVNSIDTKTNKLKETNQHLDIENRIFKTKNTELEDSVIIYKEKIKNLKNKNNILKVSSGIKQYSVGNSSLSNTKRNIDNLIREIDKCITLLKG